MKKYYETRIFLVSALIGLSVRVVLLDPHPRNRLYFTGISAVSHLCFTSEMQLGPIAQLVRAADS